MRHIVRVARRVEAKFEDLHAGQAGIGQELFDLGRGVAQILGDEIDLGKPVFEHAHEIHAGAGLPAAAPGGRVAEGHGPVALKAAEVVDADHVVELLGAVDAADPPAEAVALHCVPVVERVAPELAVLCEGIGRHAGHLAGHALAVELEVFGLRPDVRGVERHIDGHVADEADALAVGVIAQRLPLAEEEDLQEDPEVHLVLQLLVRPLHGLAAVQAQILIRPLAPAGHAVAALERHEQRVIPDPGVVPPEGRHLLREALPAAFVGQAQHREAVGVDLAVVDAGGV